LTLETPTTSRILIAIRTILELSTTTWVILRTTISSKRRVGIETISSIVKTPITDSFSKIAFLRQLEENNVRKERRKDL
jgi:hypothetical protein